MTLQVIKAEEVRDGEPRWWCPDDVYAARTLEWIVTGNLHTEWRREADAFTLAIVDRPAPMSAPGLDLEAVEATHAGMTPPKWLWSGERKCIDATQLGTDGAVHDRYSFGPVDIDELWDDDDAATWAKDAAGIVALRNAAPALIAEVRALRAEVARLTAAGDIEDASWLAMDAKLAEAKRLGLEACEAARLADSDLMRATARIGAGGHGMATRHTNNIAAIAAALEAL